MKTGEFIYEIKCVVTLQSKEYLLLIKLAKLHYDDVCVAVGLLINEQHERFGSGKTNGFLAQFTLLNTGTAVWPFQYFDITAKILEMRGLAYAAKQLSHSELRLADELAESMNEAMNRLAEEYRRLADPI